MKNKFFNILMVISIFAIISCGALFVHNLKSGKQVLGSANDIQANNFGTITSTKGNVRIQRKGIGYTLKNDTIIVDNDELTTLNKSSLELAIDDNSKITVDENSKLSSTVIDDIKQYLLDCGNIFVNAQSHSPITFSYKKGNIIATDAVFSISVYEGVPNVNVYCGEIELVSTENQSIKVTQGNSAFLSTNGDINTAKFSSNSMNDFNINQAKKIQQKELCFTSVELEEVLSNRAKMVENALKEKEQRKQQLLSQGKKEIVVGVNSKPAIQSSDINSYASNFETAQESTNENSDNISSMDEIIIDYEKTSSEYVNDSIINEDTPNKNISTAVIEINCHTLLNNMDKLTAGKDIYVPDNGVILNAVTVEFSEGESVFDILKRVCADRGIQLEYAWTPLYNSHYIEGINNLYEFDGGDGSGWMYQVNGWTPNYGVSAYKVQAGDYISFNYTCNLGNDLGNAMAN